MAFDAKKAVAVLADELAEVRARALYLERAMERGEGKIDRADCTAWLQRQTPIERRAILRAVGLPEDGV